MKMFSGTIKGLGALFVVWMTYINTTFSPLFWVLLALIFVDLLLNIHKEGQQFHKLASMGMSLGIPTVIAQNINQPELGKYLVAILCLAYLQVVVPEISARIKTFTFSKDKAKNQVDQATVAAILAQLQAKATTEAQAVEDSVKKAGIVSPEDKQGGA